MIDKGDNGTIKRADNIQVKVEPGILARFADRWIYVFMAVLLIVIALIGFIPSSFKLLALVDSGQRPPLPPLLHAHALIMGSWLLLLFVQTALVATSRTAQHRMLGVIGAILAVALLVVAISLVKSKWSNLESLPPDAVSQIKPILSGFLLEQIRELVLFAVFIAWALRVRKGDSETHKRLILFATFLPMSAAIDRVEWMPTTLPDSPTSVYLGMLSLLLPVLIYDVWRRGSVHRAYVVGLALNVPFLVASHLLWNSPWWAATAPKLVGIEAW